MLDMQVVLRSLQFGNEIITTKIIADLIKENASVQINLVRKYNAYCAIGLPITSRSEPKTGKANNKLVNDYRGEIVDQIVGYLFGNPVTYSLKIEVGQKAEDTTYKKNLQVLKDFNQLNNSEELDAETGKMMSVCGRAARLLYIDRDGKERQMDVRPWEVIFVYDQSLDEVQYAMRYYNVYDMSTGKPQTRTRVEWYDDKNVSYYISSDKGYVADYMQVQIDTKVVPVSSQAHLFDRVPLIDFQNNSELLGDFEKTESLIDGYDRVVSDAQNEIEDLRLAYLIFKGVIPDEGVLAEAKRTGAFGCEKDDEIGYLTKSINDAFIENQKKSLRENIYRFSKTVDVNADTFTGSGASGEARKWLLLALENRGSTKERKFKSGIHTLFSIIVTAWKKKGININPNDIEVQLDRNLPAELKQEAEIQSMLKGIVSDRTRLKLFSIIKDVDEEIRQLEVENDLKVDLDEVPIDKNIEDPDDGTVAE